LSHRLARAHLTGSVTSEGEEIRRGEWRDRQIRVDGYTRGRWGKNAGLPVNEENQMCRHSSEEAGKWYSAWMVKVWAGSRVRGKIRGFDERERYTHLRQSPQSQLIPARLVHPDPVHPKGGRNHAARES